MNLQSLGAHAPHLHEQADESAWRWFALILFAGIAAGILVGAVSLYGIWWLVVREWMR